MSNDTAFPSLLSLSNSTPASAVIVVLSDSRKKFVAHERFQYILLKKFGETDVQVSCDKNSSC